MEGRISKYLLILLIIIYSIQAVPKSDFESKSNQLDNKLNKIPQKGVKTGSRKQSNDENSSFVHLNDHLDYLDEPDGKFDDALDESQNADDQEWTVSVPADEELVRLFDNEPQADEPDSNKKKFKNKQSRSLAVGDTITPEELLEVTKRLMEKVNKPGKGVVSQSKNEYELADKIFERYFLTSRRIVVIKATDIHGLDALQALSLDGDVIYGLKLSSESFTEGPSLMFHGFKADPSLKLNGDELEDYPNKCHYKVLRKWVKEKPTSNNGENQSKRRTAVNLKKRLGKNRNLVVNPSRKKLVMKVVVNVINHHGKKKGHLPRNKKSKKIKDQSRTSITSKNKSAYTKNAKKSNRIRKQKKKTRSNAENATDNGIICRWKYQCAAEFDLHTCRLHPICSNQTEYKHSFSGEETDENLRRFRELVGLSLLDEKVEKIIEAHIINTRPQNKKPSKKIDNLIYYFNKIVESAGLDTTPMPNQRNLTSYPHTFMKADADSAISDPLTSDEEPDPITPDPMAEDDLEARRILGLIPGKKNNKPFTKPK